MTPLLWRALLRYPRRHPWQLMLSITGIALGVAVVLAVDIATASARQSFTLAQQQLSGGASHRIVSADGSDGVDVSLYRSLRVDHGLQHVSPVVTGLVSPVDQPGRQLRLLGVDILHGGRFAEPAVGNASGADDGELAALLVEPGAALLPADLGERLSVRVDERDEPALLTAAGPLYGNDNRGLIVVDISTAMTLLERKKLSFISVSLRDLDIDAVAAAETRLRALLPPGLRLVRAAERDRELAELSASFSLNLSALSLLALLVGMFLIYNTMTFMVVQRRRLLGLLRAVGVSRRELFVGILGEALLIGCAGTALGALFGVWLATGLVGLVSQTVSDLYYTLTLQTFALGPLGLAKALGLGLLGTLVAALVPALEAARAPPGAALSRASLETRWRSLLPRLLAGAALLMIAALLLLNFSRGLTAGFAGLFLLLIGCALLVPATVLGCATVLGWLAPGPLSAMALRDLGRQLSRTGVAVAALMIAFAATVGVGVMVDSFRGGVSGWLERLLSADLYISAAAERGASADLGAEVVDRIAAEPGLAGVSRYRWRSLDIGGRPLQLGAIDLTPAGRASYTFSDGEPDQIWRFFDDGDAVLISEPFAYRHRLGRGDLVTLPTPDGPVGFTIAGVFHDYSSEHGRALIDLDLYRRHWRDDALTSLALYAGPDVDVTDLQTRLERGAGRLQTLEIYSSGALYRLSLEVFDRTFTVTNVLRLLAIIVAVLGMLGALLALALERARDFATLRALGMSAAQIGAIAWLQAGVLGLIAGLLALPVGLLLARLLIGVINRRAFGWTMPFQIDTGLLTQTVLLALGSALLAGLYPLWRQRRADVSADLRAE